MDRRGICLACHEEIPEHSLAVSLLHHVAAKTGMLPRTPKDHHALVHKTLLFAAWTQVGAGIGGPIVGGVFILWLLLRYRRRKAAAAAAAPDDSLAGDGEPGSSER